ncbi:restriction endonuclease subunit S [Aquabacterium lacunae]|uniref:Restriction endonuclease subunit S n=1 Tax=Aquabacterium lacunae TaxID=2528630 RepID=A0A4Q9H5M5_9BURK|nr:restriction endonuclease subunit S [Aquabacterium lacunae]TBO34050.1 restriction endonuclease subunit S [Aquabacterium lacunae]
MSDIVVPFGWKQTSLAALASYVNGFAFNDQFWSEEGLPIVRIAQITGSQPVVDRFDGQLPSHYRLDDGDLIFSWSGTLAVVRWSGGAAWLNQHLFKVEPKADVHGNLLFHLLQRSVAEMDKRAHGSTMKHIKRGELAEYEVLLPTDLKEQGALTEVLDTLDTTIRQTEAIIAKLKQVKQGLLHDLLTRGIDANGELRPPQSEAPRKWRIERMGTLMEGAPRNGIYKPASDIGAGTLLIGQTAFTPSGSVDASLARRTHLTKAEQEMFSLRREDLLVSRVFATREGIGQPVLVPDFGEPAVFESNMMRVRCRADLIRAPYLFHWLKHRTSRAWLMSRAFASNQASINRETLCGLPVHLPPVHEQDQILSIISAQDARLGCEVDEMIKLKQLKSGLMDDLLTGRVRVTPLLQDHGQSHPEGMA